MVFAYECKVTTNWSIKKENFLKIIDSNRILRTKDIQTNIPGCKYCFGMEEQDGDVVISINDDNMRKTKVKELTVSIPSADFKGDLLNDADVPEDNYFYGWENTVVIKREDILDPEKSFFVDDILTMKFRGIVEFAEKQNAKTLIDILRDSEEDKDFTLVVEEAKIRVHKFILRRYSSVFTEMFNSNVNQIEIKEFDYDTVYHSIRYCYDFIYNEKIDVLIECLRFADIYDMPLVKEQIAYEISEKIDTTNVCNLANKSIEFKCPTLKGYCVSFISKCMKDGEPYDGALDLKAEIVQEIYKSSICYTETS